MNMCIKKINKNGSMLNSAFKVSSKLICPNFSLNPHKYLIRKPFTYVRFLFWCSHFQLILAFWRKLKKTKKVSLCCWFMNQSTREGRDLRLIWVRKRPNLPSSFHLLPVLVLDNVKKRRPESWRNERVGLLRCNVSNFLAWTYRSPWKNTLFPLDFLTPVTHDCRVTPCHSIVTCPFWHCFHTCIQFQNLQFART